MKRRIENLHLDDGGPTNELTPVLLVHSCGGSSSHFGAQLGHLRKTRRAIALDLRGHGDSPLVEATAAPGVAAFCQDLSAVIEALRLARVVLVGHSMGGAVCIAYAGAHPDRVAGLFLIDPSSDGRGLPPEMTAPFMQGLRDEATYWPTVEGYYAPMVEGSAPAVRAAVLGELERADRRAVVAALDDLLRFDPVTPLRAYSGPKQTLITALNEEPQSLQHLDPGLPAVKIEGTGHWPHLDKPDEVNGHLDRFLAGL